MAIDKKVIDQLLTDYKKPEDIIGENGLLKELTKAILERGLEAEMMDHLGYEKHDPAGHHRGNTRNGKSQKQLKGDFGELELETARDRKATFDPKIVAKGQRRWTGFDDKIISMYARGMTTREIQGHLEEIYGIEVSPTLISNVTDEVMEEVKLWQGDRWRSDCAERRHFGSVSDSSTTRSEPMSSKLRGLRVCAGHSCKKSGTLIGPSRSHQDPIHHQYIHD